MRTLLIILAISIPAVAQTAGKTGDAFDAEIAKARHFAQQGRWKPAQKTVLDALEAHREQPHAFLRKVEIEEILKTCAFRIRNPAPDPKTLVSGELLACNLETGRLRIRYTLEQLRDWECPAGIDALVHPAGFSGPYTIEVKGDRYPGAGTSPLLIVGATPSTAYLVVFGIAAYTEGSVQRWVPGKIVRSPQGTTLDEKESSPCRPGKPFALKVKVTEGSILASYNNRTFLSATKPKNLWGRVGFNVDDISEVIIDGTAEPSWLQGRIDRALAEARAKFDAEFDVKQVMPAWIYGPRATPSIPPAASDEGSDEDRYPDELEPAHTRVIDQVEQQMKQGRYQAALRTLRSPAGEGVPAASRQLLSSLCLEELGRLDEARKAAERLVELAPTFGLGHVVLAQILVSAGDEAAAIEALEAAREARPGDATVCTNLVQLQLLLGKPKEAQATLDQAMAAGARGGAIDALGRMLAKARLGPGWPKAHQFRSQHFLVVSDIDVRTCEEAARILEESYLAYTVHLTNVKGGGDPFKVYLFSGESGYLAYVNDLLGGAPLHTAGLYSPLLKHLLIWNLPSRDEMMRTVRHEGFHQYLDRLMRVPPTWFNEGLAEYFETSRYVGGRWKMGEPRKDHLGTLATRGLLPLSEFLHQGRAAFYADAERHYAQAWAFIHFLRHGGAERERQFKQLWSTLLEGPGARKTLETVFPDEALAELDLAFAAHLASLQ